MEGLVLALALLGSAPVLAAAPAERAALAATMSSRLADMSRYPSLRPMAAELAALRARALQRGTPEQLAQVRRDYEDWERRANRYFEGGRFVPSGHSVAAYRPSPRRAPPTAEEAAAANRRHFQALPPRAARTLETRSRSFGELADGGRTAPSAAPVPRPQSRLSEIRARHPEFSDDWARVAAPPSPYVPVAARDFGHGLASFLGDIVTMPGRVVGAFVRDVTGLIEGDRRQDRRYATRTMAMGLYNMALDLNAKGLPTLRFGDISQAGGGHISGHASHHDGKNADVRLYGHPAWDAEILKSALRSMQVKQFYLNQSRIGPVCQALRSDPAYWDQLCRYHGAGALLRRWRGHTEHVHIRIY